MKKLFIGLVILMMMSSAAFAGVIGDTGQVKITRGNFQTGIGGEFRAEVVGNWLTLGNYAASTGTTNSFQTFCLEARESLSYGTTYDAVVNTAAVWGGVGLSGDPLSIATGWLYSQFARGTLADYNFDITNAAARKVSAGLLQNAIWFLEDEIASDESANPFVIAAVTKFGSIDNAKKDGADIYGVYALNLTVQDEAGKVLRRQDVLVMVPDGGLTVLLLGMAFAGIAGISRRFRS
ncbi:MAG TPA: VPDSG-CTERM sorting domain-containing protein [Acidobacteriota bacterium]|nr:VPDSG-CTERM sorting domain-containing protein [Acidobacteriota bacterium]